MEPPFRVTPGSSGRNRPGDLVGGQVIHRQHAQLIHPDPVFAGGSPAGVLVGERDPGPQRPSCWRRASMKPVTVWPSWSSWTSTSTAPRYSPSAALRPLEGKRGARPVV